jgi:hypothetical protein
MQSKNYGLFFSIVAITCSAPKFFKPSLVKSLLKIWLFANSMDFIEILSSLQSMVKSLSVDR